MLVIPKEGEESGGGDGGGFWQSFISSFGSCDETRVSNFDNKEFQRKQIPKIVPPPIDSKIPESEIEKQNSTDKEQTNEIKPSKPFYYVLPPNSDYLYFYPQSNFISTPSNFNSFYYRQNIPQSTTIKSVAQIQEKINLAA